MYLQSRLNYYDGILKGGGAYALLVSGVHITQENVPTYVGSSITVPSGYTVALGSETISGKTYQNAVLKLVNTLTVTAKSGLKYTGSAQALVTPGSAQGTVYYSTQTALTSSNYTSGSTTVPSGTNAGTYTVYYYTPGNDSYAPKAGSVSVTISRIAPTLSASPATLTVPKGISKTSTVTYNGDGSLSVASNATGVATTSISSKTVTVNGIAKGTATITITASQGVNYYAASTTIAVTVTNPPTIAITEVATNNIGWEGWRLSTGATINANNELVLSASGQYASKYFQVDGTPWQVGCYMKSAANLTTDKLYISTVYYNESWERIKSQNGYDGNGYTYGGSSGDWVYGTFDGYSGYGENVKYVQITLNYNASSTSSTLYVKDVNFSSKMDETYVGARYTATADGGSISSIKYLWSTSSSGVTASQITNEGTDGAVAYPAYGAKGTYYLWVYAVDSNGGSTVQRSDAYTIDNPEIEVKEAPGQGAFKKVNVYAFNQPNIKNFGPWSQGTITTGTSKYYGSVLYNFIKTGTSNQFHGGQPDLTALGGAKAGTYVIVSSNYSTTDAAGLTTFAGQYFPYSGWTGGYWEHKTVLNDINIIEDGEEHHTFLINQLTEDITGNSAILGSAFPNWHYSTEAGSMTMEGNQLFIFSDLDEGIAVKKYAVGNHPITYFKDNGTEFTGTSFNATENGTYTVYTKTTSGVERVKTVEVTGVIDLAGPDVTITNNGSALYSDPEFATSFNGTSIYDNSGNVTVTRTRVMDETAPNNSAYVMHIKTAGAASPGHGGFTFYTQSAANEVYIVKIIAKIPTGYTLNKASNAVGENSTGINSGWLTSNAGTGGWKTYIYRLNTWPTGNFKTTNFFYLTGGSTATEANPVEWDVAFAQVYRTDVMDWTNQNVTLTGNATDKKSGTVAYAFTTTDAEPTTWTDVTSTKNTVTGTTSATANGDYYFWAKDIKGNVGKTAIRIDKIDKTKPTIGTVTMTPSSASTYTISISNLADDLSGVAGYYVSTSGTTPTASSSWTPYTSSSLTLTGIAEETTRYIWLIDNAGNISERTTLTTNKIAYTINDTSWYETLQQAITAASSGNTIKVIKDVTDSSQATVPSGKTLTLDTNSKTITKTSYTITNNGTLTITGTGTITTSGAFNLITNNGTTNITGACTLSQTSSGAYSTIFGNGNLNITANAKISCTSYVAINHDSGNTSTMTISAGTISGKFPLCFRGTTLNITGGTITGNSSYAIYNGSTGTVNISNATITGKTYGIQNNRTGTININSGTISGGEHGVFNEAAGTVNIKGGTITGETHGVYSANAGGTVTIGTSDSSVSKDVPVIKGRTNGVNVAGNLTYYDGIIEGREAALSVAGTTITQENSLTYVGNTITVPSGYTISLGTATIDSETYQTAVLKLINTLTVTGKTGLVYDKTAQTLATIANAQGSVYFSTSAELTSSNYTSGSTTISTGTNAGTYKVYYYTPGNDDYAAKAGSVTVTIAKAVPTLTVDPATMVILKGHTETSSVTYDGDGVLSVAPTSTDEIEASVTDASVANRVVSIKGKLPVDSQTITVSAAEGTNYLAKSATINVKVETSNYSVNDVHYKTLADAYGSVTGSSAIIVLEESNTDPSDMTVTNGKTITLMLTEGKTITKTTATITVNSGGTLIITGTGTITTSGAFNLITNNGTLNITGACTLSQTATTGELSTIKGIGGLTVTANATLTSLTYPAVWQSGIRDKGAITISAGTFSGRFGIGFFGPTLTITGGSITGSGNYGIRNFGTGTVNITGGTITGKTYGVENASTGTINIGTLETGVTTSTPVIVGQQYGVYTETSGINFYDGIVKGETAALNVAGTTITAQNASEYVGDTITTPDGYGVFIDSETISGTEYETATLVTAWDVSNTAGTDNVWAYLVKDPEKDGMYKLVIRGTGEMKNFADYDDVPWVNHRNLISELVIEEGITAVGNKAFHKLNQITTIKFPSTLTFIGNYVFLSCTAKGTVTIPASVTTIGNNPFIGVPIDTIVVESGNTKYESHDGVLYSKNNVDLVAYPYGKTASIYTVLDGTTNIRNYAFYRAKATNIILPESLVRIREYAFQNTEITSIVIPKNVAYIYQGAFDRSSNLEKVYLESTKLSTLGTDAFTNLKSGSIIYTTSKTVADKFVGGTNYTAANTTIYYPPEVTTDPSDVTVTYPEKATFTVVATNGIPEGITYRWQYRTSSSGTWTNVTEAQGTGGTTATFTTNSTLVAMTGYQYRCIIGSSAYPNTEMTVDELASVLISEPATLTVKRADPQLTANPETITILKGHTENATMTYNGDGTLTGATSNSTSIATATVSGKTVSIKGLQPGTATITVSLGQGANHLAATKDITVEVVTSNYSVNDVHYRTLQDALSAITGASGTIKVEETNTDSSTFVITGGKTITIDTNGKKITKTGDKIAASEQSTLIITGTGTIEGSIYAGNGTVNLKSGTIIGNIFGGNVTGSATQTNIILDGSTIQGNIYGGGNVTTSNITIKAGSVQNVYGGSLKGEIVTNVNITVQGTANIEKNIYGGGVNTSIGTAQANGSVTINIVGGTIGGNVYGSSYDGTVYGNVNINIGKDATGNSNLPINDLEIVGNIYGGGIDSDATEYELQTVTGTSNIKIDGNGYTNFDVNSSIFGSGQIATTNASNITIKNLGANKAPHSLVSIQRAGTLTIDNANLEIIGIADEHNLNKEIAFTLNRIGNLKVKNGTTLHLRRGFNKVEEYNSLVDVNGTETKSSVTIANEQITSSNVTNRIYVYEGINLIIAKKEYEQNVKLTEYGKVNGMTFFGMYARDRKTLALKYDIYDPSSPSDGNLFALGSYVEGLYDNTEATTVDGFYTNVVTEEDAIIPEYIEILPYAPTYQDWIVGLKTYTQEVTIIAKKDKDRAHEKIEFDYFVQPGNEYNITLFSVNSLEPGISLVDKSQILPKAATSSIANTTFALTMKNSDEGWKTNGETNFYSDETTPITGTMEYNSDDSGTIPSFDLFLHNSLNIDKDSDCGLIHMVFLLKQTRAGVPVEGGTYRVAVSVYIKTENQTDLQNFETESYVTEGKDYGLFVQNEVDITDRSSMTFWSSIYPLGTYTTGDYRALVTSCELPKGTQITMIDYAQSGAPQVYYYEVNTYDALGNGKYMYYLTNFKLMGTVNGNTNYANPNSVYATSGYEEYRFIIDFKNTTLTQSITDQTISLELRDGSTDALKNVQITTNTFSVHKGSNTELTLDVTPADTNVSQIITQGQLSFDILSDIDIPTAGANKIKDTYYEGRNLGISIALYDSQNNRVPYENLKGVYFVIQGEEYFPDPTGVTRVYLSDNIVKLGKAITANINISSLPAGDYKIRIENYTSDDGMYYGTTVEQQYETTIKVIDGNFGLQVNIDDKDILIDSATGKTFEGDNAMKMTVKTAAISGQANIRVKLYRRNTTVNENLSFAGISYTEVDLQDYVTNTLTKPANATSDYQYLLTDNISNGATLEKTYNLSTNLPTGGHKLVFEVYVGDICIGTVERHIVITDLVNVE